MQKAYAYQLYCYLMSISYMFIQLFLDASCEHVGLLWHTIYSQYAQIPDIKENTDSVDAVLVDEEAVGPVDTPGCGAKILRGGGAFERLLHETKSGEPMVCFLSEIKNEIAL